MIVLFAFGSGTSVEGCFAAGHNGGEVIRVRRLSSAAATIPSMPSKSGSAWSCRMCSPSTATVQPLLTARPIAGSALDETRSTA